MLLQFIKSRRGRDILIHNYGFILKQERMIREKIV